MAITEIPFAGNAYNMPATQLDAQTCINWYVVADKTGKYQLSLIPRPGLSLFANDQNNNSTRGHLSLNDILYEVIDNKLFAVFSDQSKKELGTLNTSVGYVKIIANASQLLICDGRYGYVYQIIGTDIYDKGLFFVITEASSIINDPVFIGSGINDLTPSGKYLGDLSTTYRVEIDRANYVINPSSFVGSGANDLTTSLTYSGTTDKTFRVQIDGTGSPNTFRWSIDGGATWVASTVGITGNDQTLQNDFKIKFTATTGHNLNDYWNILVTMQTGNNAFRWSDNNGSTWNATNVTITGEVQKLSNGLFIAFNSTTGHTLGDAWLISIDVASSFYPPIFPASQDGYGIYPVQNSNRVYISGINDFNSVDPLDYQLANVYSDNNVAAISVNQEVYIIKQQSTEIWNNVGATTEVSFPFQRRSNIVINYGCEAPFTVCAGSTNIIFMLSRNKAGSRMFVMIANYNASVISTEPLNAELLTYNKVDDAYSDIIEINDHIFIYTTFPSIDKTWVYDLNNDLWSQWTSQYPNELPAVGNRFGKFRGMFHAILAGKHLIGDSVTGKIFQFDASTYLDYDMPIEFERISPHFSVNNQWVTIHSLMVDVERGVAKQSGQGENPTIMLQISRDGGKTWGNQLWRTSGKVGEYKHRVLWYQLGTSRQFTFKVRCTDPVYNVILGIVADIEAS